MKNLIMVGNSGAALECYELFQTIYYHSNSYKKEFQFKGFLRYNNYAGCLENLQYLELGSDNDYQPDKDDVFIIAIGNNALRMQAYEKLKARRFTFINLVSPWAYICDGEIGEANIITIGCHIAPHVKIGNCNYLNGDVRLAHHVQVGDGNFFGPRSMAMGNSKIGNNNAIAPSVIFLENSKIGSNNTIAPGAIVYKGCKDNCLMAGNPALIINEKHKSC